MININEILKGRKTIRKYTNKTIPTTLLNDLLEKACRSSNTGNMQTYSVVATTSEEMKEKLSPIHFNQSAITNAPLLLTFCVDFNRFTEWCKLRNADAAYGNFQSFIGGVVDTIIVAQTFAIAAEAEGLGICYFGTTTYNAASIVETLHLPRLVVPITTLTVGYPDEDPKQTDRLALNAILHQETYRNYTATQINDIYREKEELSENMAFVEENKKENLAQVFTDVRYTRENNEIFSKAFSDLLKRQGFIFN